MQLAIWTILLAGSLVGCLPAQAEVVFSNFGPNHALTQGGWAVSGAKNTNLWKGHAVKTAESFTSSVSGDVFLKIEIAIQLIAGSNAFLLTLNQDSNGTPGQLLQQWQLTQVPPFGDGSPSFNGFETVTSNERVLLRKGSAYWLVVSALDQSSTTDGAWHDSPTNVLPNSQQQIDGNGWQSSSKGPW